MLQTTYHNETYAGVNTASLGNFGVALLVLRRITGRSVYWDSRQALDNITRSFTYVYRIPVSTKRSSDNTGGLLLWK